jgi:hypothetical protein
MYNRGDVKGKRKMALFEGKTVGIGGDPENMESRRKAWVFEVIWL